jgi:hypothetical protein
MILVVDFSRHLTWRHRSLYFLIKVPVFDNTATRRSRPQMGLTLFFLIKPEPISFYGKKSLIWLL